MRPTQEAGSGEKYDVRAGTGPARRGGLTDVNWAAAAAVGALVPLTIFVIVVCALALRSVRSSGEQAYTLQMLDRLIRLARALWPGNWAAAEPRRRPLPAVAGRAEPAFP